MIALLHDELRLEHPRGLGHRHQAGLRDGLEAAHPGRHQLRQCAHDRKSVTLVHKGNIMKFTEGAFRNWGYELVREEFADVAVGWDDCGGEPGRQDPRQGRDRRHHAPAGAHPTRRVRRDRHH